MTTYERDESMPLIEQVREITYANTDIDEPLEFTSAALALGCNEREAEALDMQLTERGMRTGGMI